MVKDHSDSERRNPLLPHGLLFPISSKVFFLYAPSHRQDCTYHGLCYTSRGALAGTRNSSMGPPHEGSIRRPIAPWANALTTELRLAPVSWLDIGDGGGGGGARMGVQTADEIVPRLDRDFMSTLVARCSSVVERVLIMRWVVGSMPHGRRARCSSVVERPLMVRWVVGLIPHGGSTQLLLFPASAQRLVIQRPWYVLSCMCDGAYNRPLVANQKE